VATYLLLFHISGRDPGMQGLVELGRLTCIHLYPWGRGVSVFVGLGSGLDIVWLAGALIIPVQEDISCTEMISKL